MASIKNAEVCDILQQWLDKSGISNPEAARQLEISYPVLWRQLNAKDSIPLTRIIEFVRRWAPSNEAIERLEDLLNDCPLPEDKTRVFDFERCIGRLEAVSAMMKNAIYNSVPDEVKVTVRSMTDLLDASIDDLNMKKTRKATGTSKKKIILPRKSKLQVQIDILKKEISDLETEHVHLYPPEYFDVIDGIETEVKESPDEKAAREAKQKQIQKVIDQKKAELEELEKKLKK